MSRLITLLGVVASVAAVVAAGLSAINPMAAVWVMLVGNAACAAGRELVNPTALRNGAAGLRRGLPRRGSFSSPASKKTLRGLLVIGMAASLFVTSACGIKSISREALTILRVDAVNYIDARERAGQITAEQAEAQRARFGRLAAAYAPVDEKIQAARRLDARTAADILPEAEAFVSALDAENVINRPSGPVARRIAEFDFVLRGLARRILDELRRRGRVNEAEMKRDVARLKELMAA